MEAPLNLLNVVEFSEAKAPQVAGSTAITSNTVDMAGYESVLVVVKLGDVTATATLNLKGQSGEASNGSDATDISGCTTGTLTAAASDYDSKFLLLDIIKPKKRYVTAVLTRAVANAVVESMIFIRYGRRLNPTPNAEAKTPTVAAVS